ncbi:MAG: DUF1016 N-terminal domain-containing protein [Rhodoferax sp.]|nr:DUF1016 N-terminal domain-containing protein [Rhodoferax sp.]
MARNKFPLNAGNSDAKVAAPAADLGALLGSLRHMRAFYTGFPIWNALRTELSWTHYRALLRVEDAGARTWYMNEAADQNWSARALDRQVSTLYYERLLASPDRQPLRAELVREQQLLADLAQSRVDDAPEDLA